MSKNAFLAIGTKVVSTLPGLTGARSHRKSARWLVQCLAVDAILCHSTILKSGQGICLGCFQLQILLCADQRMDSLSRTKRDPVWRALPKTISSMGTIKCPERGTMWDGVNLEEGLTLCFICVIFFSTLEKKQKRMLTIGYVHQRTAFFLCHYEFSLPSSVIFQNFPSNKVTGFHVRW